MMITRGVTLLLALVACGVTGAGAKWSVQQETAFLVFRDTTAPNRDFRVALSPGQYKDFGTPRFAQENSVMADFASWRIGEENGVLVVRDMAAHARGVDARYAFYPASSADWAGGPPLYKDAQVLARGVRWLIAVENGVLVLRDTLSLGDNRYAFWPGQYTDL
eukprot:TRINITY_DN27096_c0_g1_i1.p2 TRINITY_DN27096_c0_g1~~TRINITY_DN27096_c0_g1_i1.p2  ORF type:complete len:163 (+),score=48.68 TRINITY_DN27096_c0_g1_i1:90-578(+)